MSPNLRVISSIDVAVCPTDGAAMRWLALIKLTLRPCVPRKS